VDARGARGRPRSRQEARSRARRQLGQKRDLPPTWSTALTRGVFGAAIFLLALVVFLKQPFASSLVLAIFMLLLYIPMGYYIERFMYNRRQASARRERERRARGG
jgi:hypothetical protein